MISVLESLLFAVGDEGLTLINLSNVLDLETEEIIKLLDKLKAKYDNDKDSGLNLSLLGNTYKITTKKENKEYLEKLSIETSNSLSTSALETLAIIAYNEPVTRIMVDEIRGIQSSQMIRNLISKGFVESCGKSEEAGKPNLYKTTNRFLDYFGLSTKDDLPKLNNEEIEILEDDDLFLSRYKEVGE